MKKYNTADFVNIVLKEKNVFLCLLPDGNQPATRKNPHVINVGLDLNTQHNY
jgi:hypothetical protein